MPILSNLLQIGKNFVFSHGHPFSYLCLNLLHFFNANKSSPPHLSPTTDEVKKTCDRLENDYAYWTDAKYRAKGVGLTPEQLWAHLKAARERKMIVAWPSFGIHFALTSEMQRVCHETD